MPIDFSFLDGTQNESTSTQTRTATVTIRVDADSLLLCDGEYIDHPLKAGVLTKIQLPLGQHILEFLYAEDPDIKVEKEVDFPEAGKCYLVLIKDFKNLADEAKRMAAEEEAKRTPEALMEAKLLKEKSGTINGYDYVDLGLPSGLKWATCNVGASSPEQYGDYYAWAELNTKKYYDDDDYEEWDCIDCVEDISDNPAYDVARAKWGSGWRMPTESELKELLEKCKWERIVLVGKNGYMVTGPNGNSIFIPAAGYRYESQLNDRGKEGNYWSSTPKNDMWAFCLEIGGRSNKLSYTNPVAGLSVRPVSELRM